jgi:hypothetical protein
MDVWSDGEMQHKFSPKKSINFFGDDSLLKGREASHVK